ncbi:hypothetical protein KEG38_33580 [Polyangium jinanense]|uniref:Cytochrome c domain-containing protein n=1 Tax=Polyangium jinanense TaxID=2829994 RepID=A0A9X4AY00_9BACT|nr:hypothetical protein [Polyangium jinanense]MDC3989198.1 hypothetical protein [Polyangium jinanense]
MGAALGATFSQNAQASVASPSAASSAASSYTLFESGQVRPVAMSPSGNLLFVVNTPDNRLEIFRLTYSGILEHTGSVPVGLEPVAVAARSNSEVWVVNHLSDSVSIINVTGIGRGSVVRTLHVGDEPRDIVFAGPSKNRAFITTAHRGQNAPFDPQLTTPGVGRADVWVFDALNLGTTMGGTPLKILNLFGDTPRALAATPDGSRVYAAVFHSGNRTTIVDESLVPNGGEDAGGVPGPNTNFEGIPAPEVGVLVKHDGTSWRDVLGRPWDDAVNFSLPDKDVFVIDANASPPKQLTGSAGFYAGVGTVLFNMAVNPVNGRVYVSNTEARNDLRFEGDGLFAGETLQGHLHESRITVLGPGGVVPRHLNKHIDYDVRPAPLSVNQRSLAQPLGMAVSSSGTTLYVAAFASSKIGVFNTAALENNSFVPSATSHITLSGGGPTGIVLDEGRARMYVLTRFDNGLSVVSLSTQKEIAHIKMYSPEPDSIVEGRALLYDARLSSSNGEAACGSCHVFGDMDDLSWDLGNPDGSVLNNPGPFKGPLFVDPDFHPMKGPMATQSLRGMANHGTMHWRADRTGGNDEPSAQPDQGAFDEVAAFKKFNPAFVGLLGRTAELSAEDMQRFTDFILQVAYPPNPIRNLDNSLTPSQQAGRDFFFNTPVIGPATCATCHPVNPNANPNDRFPGFFGADGFSGFGGAPQILKNVHLRGQYQKVGMFGSAVAFGSELPDPFMGDQIRGFGFTHDGSTPTLFHRSGVFDKGTPILPEILPEPITVQPGIPLGPEGDQIKRNMEAYQLAFDTNFAPIVGQQVTLTVANQASAAARIELLLQRANAFECDLVAKGVSGSSSEVEVGYLYIPEINRFVVDQQAIGPIPDAVLRSVFLGSGKSLTYTCVPPGSGVRIGIDRDLDGYLDGDEIAAGSNPANPLSTP